MASDEIKPEKFSVFFRDEVGGFEREAIDRIMVDPIFPKVRNLAMEQTMREVRAHESQMRAFSSNANSQVMKMIKDWSALYHENNPPPIAYSFDAPAACYYAIFEQIETLHGDGYDALRVKFGWPELANGTWNVDGKLVFDAKFIYDR